MRTNIVIDRSLLARTFSLSKAKIRKEFIHEALYELIRFTLLNH